VRITNQLLPLDRASFFIRICRAADDSGGNIVGLKKCSDSSNGGGGITTPAWQNHLLWTDEPWDILLGRDVPFQFDATTADIRLVVRYWPWLLPKPWFMDLREKEARLTLSTRQDGSRIWKAELVD